MHMSDMSQAWGIKQGIEYIWLLTLNKLQSSEEVSYKTLEYPNKCIDTNHGKSNKGK